LQKEISIEEMRYLFSLKRNPNTVLIDNLPLIFADFHVCEAASFIASEFKLNHVCENLICIIFKQVTKLTFF